MVGNDINVKLTYRIDANSKFLSFYIPHSAHSFEIAMGSAEFYKKHLDSPLVFKSRNTGVQTEMKSEDLLFSGRINLYAEDYFSPAQIAELQNHYEGSGAIPQIYGPDYVSEVWHNIKEGRVAPMEPYQIKAHNVVPMYGPSPPKGEIGVAGLTSVVQPPYSSQFFLLSVVKKSVK